MHPLLTHTGHRTLPLPQRPWIMKQTWHDLLFAHWAVAPHTLRPLVPAELELDQFREQAYVGVIPFWMSGIRARGTPALPGLSSFPELNVRTYVKHMGVPGVYFWSLDAASRLAVWAARKGYGLPYYHAAMSIKSLGESFEYSSRRLEGPRPAEFQGRYRPNGQAWRRDRGSLEHFVTERYCLYTLRDGSVIRVSIHHQPWLLQDAEVDIDVNTMALAAGIELPREKPLVHFARELEVLVWGPEALARLP